MSKYEEYDKMEMNPFGLPPGKFMDHYKFFSRRRHVFWEPPHEDEEEVKLYLYRYSDWSKPDVDLLIKFIVLMVDPESPHYDEINFDLRIKDCKNILGITAKSNEIVNREIDHQGKWYEQILTYYFIYANNMKYELWFSLKMNYHTIMSHARGGLVTDKYGSLSGDINARTKIGLQMDEVLEQIAKLEYELFPTERLKKLIIDYAVDDSIGGYAEKYAKYPKHGE